MSKVFLESKISSLGVVDHKHCFVSHKSKIVRNELHSAWFYFSGPITVLFYQSEEKKPFEIVLSTAHEFSEFFDDSKELPNMIHSYNQTKIGADLVDQSIKTILLAVLREDSQ